MNVAPGCCMQSHGSIMLIVGIQVGGGRRARRPLCAFEQQGFAVFVGSPPHGAARDISDHHRRGGINHGRTTCFRP